MIPRNKVWELLKRMDEQLSQARELEHTLRMRRDSIREAFDSRSDSKLREAILNAKSNVVVVFR